MDPLLGLLLLWAFSRSSHASAPGGGGLFPSPRPGKPVDKGGGGASAFPPSPPPPHVPVSASPGKWKPYPAPIPQAIVARAQALLRDPTMRINDERLEPDPAGSGQVRFWKVNQPPGKISVTAWKPSLAQSAPAPHAAAPAPSRMLATARRHAPARTARHG